MSDLRLLAAQQLTTTFGRSKSMRRNARRGGARAGAHQNWSPVLYLQSPKTYFDAHCDHSLPRAKVSSETAQRTQWAPSAFESHCRARTPRCTCWSSTNGSAATRCCAEPISAQAGEEAVNRRRMTIKKLPRETGRFEGHHNSPYLYGG